MFVIWKKCSSFKKCSGISKIVLVLQKMFAMFLFIFFINFKKVLVFKFPPQIPKILHIFIFRSLRFFHFKKSCLQILSRNFKICSHFQILFWNLEECSRLKQIFMIFRKCSYFPKKNFKKNYCFLY